MTEDVREPFRFATDLLQTDPYPIARHVFVIAEIGINHNGDVEIAKKLIDMAKSSGCDAVKFQKRTVERVYSKEVLDAPRESPWGTTQRDQKMGLELSEEEYDGIDAYCRSVGIEWFASAWDVPSQLFLRKYDLSYNKVASPMLTHLDLLETVAEEQKVTFVSTGMSTWQDVDAAVAIFKRHSCPTVVMHTVSEYPAADESLNLLVMHDLRRRYGLPVGYSGHESTMLPGVIAAAMGAVAVERHITLDHAMYGSDQAASIGKRGLEMLVSYIRELPIICGDGVKRVSDSEMKNSAKLRYWRSAFDREPTS